MGTFLKTKKIVIDLDNTLTLENTGADYSDLVPNKLVIDALNTYKKDGFEVAIYTSRNMKTFNSSIGHINATTLPQIVDWLKKHQIPYDEIHVGKPWCGEDGFYVDDRAIRPSEFVNLSHNQIKNLLNIK
jgi:capsule biosynthesis phosphatase